MNYQDDKQVFDELPRFEMEDGKKGELKYRLHQVQTDNFGWGWVSSWRVGIVSLCVLVLGVVGWFGVGSVGTPWSPAQVSAVEVVQAYLERYIVSGTIYHLKYIHYPGGESEGTEYELWEDQDSDRYYQEITYADGNRSIQAFDLDVAWSLDSASLEAYKDIHVYESEEERETRRGKRVDLGEQMMAMVEVGQAELEKVEEEGEWLYKISAGISTDMEYYWNVIWFDMDTYSIRRLGRVEEGRITEMMVYELEQVLERDEVLMAQLFTLSVPEEYTVFERTFDSSYGYVESEYWTARTGVERVQGPFMEGMALEGEAVNLGQAQEIVDEVRTRGVFGEVVETRLDWNAALDDGRFTQENSELLETDMSFKRVRLTPAYLIEAQRDTTSSFSVSGMLGEYLMERGFVVSDYNAFDGGASGVGYEGGRVMCLVIEKYEMGQMEEVESVVTTLTCADVR